MRVHFCPQHWHWLLCHLVLYYFEFEFEFEYKAIVIVFSRGVLQPSGIRRFGIGVMLLSPLRPVLGNGEPLIELLIIALIFGALSNALPLVIGGQPTGQESATQYLATAVVPGSWAYARLFSVKVGGTECSFVCHVPGPRGISPGCGFPPPARNRLICNVSYFLRRRVPLATSREFRTVDFRVPTFFEKEATSEEAERWNCLSKRQVTKETNRLSL